MRWLWCEGRVNGKGRRVFGVQGVRNRIFVSTCGMQQVLCTSRSCVDSPASRLWANVMLGLAPAALTDSSIRYTSLLGYR